jgi:hypothetical protein
MEIQRGKEGMKTMQFNQQLGATTGCTLRLLLDTIPGDMNIMRHGMREDAWFGSIWTANEVGLRAREGVFQIKQYHSLVPKEYIESELNDAPGGVHILLEGVTKDEIPLVAMGYRYSLKTILFFVLTKNGGMMKPGDPYQMKYTDSFCNICTRNADRPQVLSNFFAGSNVIDMHNQLPQDLLRLEKSWITQSPWFRLAKTYVEICIMGAFLLCDYHCVINISKKGIEDQENKISIQQFAVVLTIQWIQYTNKIGTGNSSRFLPEDGAGFTMTVPKTLTDFCLQC